jgi:hypothetical protein
MWKLRGTTWLSAFAPVWAPEGEGEGGGGGAGEGSGGGEGQGGGQGDGGQGSQGGQGGEGQGGEGEGGKARPGGILDMAQGGGKKAGDKGGEGGEGDWKLPDGLELPDHLKGKDADSTLALVAKAYKGARQELSAKGKGGEGAPADIPEKPEEYVIASQGDDDKVAAELNAEASKPVLAGFQAAAKEAGIGKAQFETFMRKGLEAAAAAGVPIGMTDQEAQDLSGEAELEALTEMYGSQVAQTKVNSVGAYGEKLVANQVLKDEADIHEFAIMVGTARSADIMSRIIEYEFGERPIPAPQGIDGKVSVEAANRAHQEALKMKPGAEREEAVAAAEKLMEKAYGTQGTGSQRVSVL